MRKLLWVFVVAFVLGVSECGYNTFQTTEEQIKDSRAKLLNQYQRRADPVPNLVHIVKGAATCEPGTLVAFINTRAKAAAINAAPALFNYPAAVCQFLARAGLEHRPHCQRPGDAGRKLSVAASAAASMNALEPCVTSQDAAEAAWAVV